ncbi:hypothetical protein [Streptomyces sp. NPDC002889]|uniref:hypothetical protein n=1 Tax=Streptomyces sp. NPDC002889 TaxID=3364669 RepID=UPI0036CCBE14
MTDEPDNIQSVYAQRFAADLEKNRSKQGDIAQQISELQGRLDRLKANEKWLSELQGTVPAPVAMPAEAEEAAVPAPRQEDLSKVAGDKPGAKRAAAKTTKKATAKKVAAPKRPTAKQTAAKKTTAEKAAQPPLRELVEGILTNHAGEPRMVSEVRTELEEHYPGRAASSQVVRNTLESLAKKGIIEKTNQQGSVMYTKPKSAPVEVDAVPAPAPAEA